MTLKRIATTLPILLLPFALSACLPGDGAHSAAAPAGFFWGIWHGWVAPISLIVGFFFKPGVRIYEVINTGLYYDLGFYMAVISGFGGLNLLRGSRSSKRA